MVTVSLPLLVSPAVRVKVSPGRSSTPSLTYSQSFVSSLKVVHVTYCMQQLNHAFSVVPLVHIQCNPSINENSYIKVFFKGRSSASQWENELG